MGARAPVFVLFAMVPDTPDGHRMSFESLRIREYQVSHRTRYRYSFAASLCHNQLHLRPREAPGQRLLHATIKIDPEPDYRAWGVDSFGNPIEFFSIERAHGEMTVHSNCCIERAQPTHQWYAGLTTAEWIRSIKQAASEDTLRAQEFLCPSSYCAIHPEFAEFLKPIWDPHLDSLQMLDAVNRYIYESIRYQPQSTDVTTSSLSALRNRQGVCQDLANIFISCMRTLGIPARYVSGYLITVPAPGQDKLVGADASHAWVSVHVGPWGWIDWDPTNNMRADLDHITLAWGRDYADVPPVLGVYVGGGDTALEVAVDVVLANERLANPTKGPD